MTVSNAIATKDQYSLDGMGKYLDDNPADEPTFLPRLTFSGKGGGYSAGDFSPQDGDRIVIGLHLTSVGWIRFNGTGERPDVELVQMSREAAPDVPAGCNRHFVVPVAFLGGTLDGKQFLLSVSNLGGVQAFEQFMREARSQAARHPGEVPTATLGSDSYTRADGGEVFVPVFELDGWTDNAGAMAPPAIEDHSTGGASAGAQPAAGGGVGGDLDDEIPF